MRERDLQQFIKKEVNSKILNNETDSIKYYDIQSINDYLYKDKPKYTRFRSLHTMAEKAKVL